MVTEKKKVNEINDFKEIDPDELTYMIINAVQELKHENEMLRDEKQKIKILPVTLD